MNISYPELYFEDLLKETGLRYEREYRFKPHRYRFDFVLPDLKVAFEIEGGIWMKSHRGEALGYGGRHTNPKGFMRDCKKYLLAQAAGWKVIRIPVPWLFHTECKKQQPYLLTQKSLMRLVLQIVEDSCEIPKVA